MIEGPSFNFGRVNSILQRSLSANTNNLNKAIQRLALGSRRPTDDVAGISISESMTAGIRGIEQAQKNVGDGISMTGTAGGGLDVINGNLQDIRELVVQAGNGTNGPSELAAIQAEISQRLTTISDIADSTQFNGKKLLDGSTGNVTLQTGANNGETMNISMSGDFSSNAAAAAGNINEGNTGGAAGVALNNIDVTTGNTNDILKGIDNAIANVTAKQSTLGASQNSLESTYSNLSVSKENLYASRSRIKDTDYASETSNFIQSQILQQGAAKLMGGISKSLLSSITVALLPT